LGIQERGESHLWFRERKESKLSGFVEPRISVSLDLRVSKIPELLDSVSSYPTIPMKLTRVNRYQNAALDYYLSLTNSSYLHYGYWKNIPVPPEELTMARFREAQAAYVDLIGDRIPAEVKTILDVGCGIGGNATYLVSKGYTVDGLAPDSFQQEKFLAKTQGKAKFYLTTFEQFQAEYTYDLVLFSESTQYMAAQDIATGAAKVLNSGGYVLLVDMMRTDASYKEGMFSNCHEVKEFQATMEQAGFKLIETKDISEQILPTIDLYMQEFRTYGMSTINYIGTLVEITVPPIYKLFQFLFGKWIGGLLNEGLSSKVIFEKHLSYKLQLWQLDNSKVIQDS